MPKIKFINCFFLTVAVLFIVSHFSSLKGEARSAAATSPFQRKFTENVVENCYIGTDAAGAVASANQYGIVIRSNNNRIGGTSALAMNVISGNSSVGVSINGDDNNTVQGNYIGTNAAGFVPRRSFQLRSVEI